MSGPKINQGHLEDSTFHEIILLEIQHTTGLNGQTDLHNFKC